MKRRRLIAGLITGLLLGETLPSLAQKRTPGQEALPYHQVSLKKYMMVDIGMSEAQVLTLLGPPSWVDKWSCQEDEGCHLKKVYYYLGNPDRREMTTVIYFTDGKVTRKERYRSWLSQ